MRHPVWLVIMVCGATSPAWPAHAAPAPAMPCERGALAHSWTREHSLVYACSYGSAPTRPRPDVWRASGIAFYKIAAAGEPPRRILDLPSSQPELEYFVDGDRLVVRLATYDPRSPSGPVPLLRENWAIAGSDIEPQIELVLEPPAADPARVDRILARLRTKQPADPKRLLRELRDLLYELRNQGLRDPKAMRTRLEPLRTAWWRKRDAADSLGAVLKELALAERTTPIAPGHHDP